MFIDPNKYTDCTFVFEEKSVCAHKLVLANYSVVFEKMFYGDLPLLSDKIYISDILYEDFQQVLNFIYTEHIEIDSVAKAWQLYYIAHKYSLDELSIQCLNYVMKNVTMSSLVLCYEYGEMYNLVEKEKWFADIVDYAKGVFECEYHMKSSTLKRILDEGSLEIDSFSLCSEILEWCTNECKYKKIAANPDNISNILRQLDILKFLNSEINTNADVQNKIKYPYYIRLLLKMAQRLYLDPQDRVVSTIVVDVNTILFGFLVSTVMNPEIRSKEYEGCITIRICCENCDVIPPTTVKDIMLYEDEYYVALKELAYLKAKTKYKVKISYEDVSRPSISVTCHFMKTVLYNNFKNSIEFQEMYGTVIRGVSFYPE